MITKYLLLILTIVLLFSACNQSYHIPQHYYTPHESNALKLRQKNDLVASGSIGTNAYSYNSENPLTFQEIENNVDHLIGSFQVAYSPIKHLGVFGSHTRWRVRDGNESSKIFHKNHLTSAGMGTYYATKFLQRPLDKILPGRKKNHDKIVLDLYGGYSIGNLQNNYFNDIGNDEYNFHKLYYQYGIHWEVGTFGLSYVQKRGIATYPSGVTFGSTSLIEPLIPNIMDNNQTNFTENTFQLDIKNEKVGIYLQYINTIARDLRLSAYPNDIINLGVTLNINGLTKTIKSKEKKLED